jgi:hypothetical protein
MKKILPLLLFTILFEQAASSQTTVISGKPITEIFTDFHLNMNDTTKTTGFGLNRAYLGYNFLPGGNFSGSVIVNIGSPDELSSGSVHRRYAYCREASLSWTNDRINISFGITGTRIFNYQQKFWGKRYIANTYQSLNGYGFIADLGVVMDYKFNDIFTGDISLTNGEGYSELQLDNAVKTSVGLTITPTKQLAIRVYGDINRPMGILQSTLVGFAGFKNDLVTVGAEVSFKSNLDLTHGHNAWGVSGTGAISVTKKSELFVRYDYSTSVLVPDETKKWNYKKDGTFLIAGVQHTFSQNVKMALNYQGTFPYNHARKISDAIFVNALFKF